MSTAQQWWESIKIKKNSILNYIRGARFNHPHRVNQITLSGTLSYEIDERLFTANASPTNGQTCYTYTIAADFADAEPWLRYFEEKCPFVHVLGSVLDPHRFALLHRPGWPWTFQYQDDPTLIDATIGTVVRRTYVYSTGTSSWSLTATDPADDLLWEWFFTITGGGDPTSGGYDATTAAEIEMTGAFLGTYGYLLSGFVWDTFQRFPWTDVWTSETTVFSNGFTAFLADRNTADGAGHTGTCSLSMDFANL